MDGDKRFLTRTEPEAALVVWRVREHPTTKLIKDEPNMVCDFCNHKLDWEPYVVIDWPDHEDLHDPEYDPVGYDALCQSCAKKQYNITLDDVGKVFRIWFCYNLVEY